MNTLLHFNHFLLGSYEYLHMAGPVSKFYFTLHLLFLNTRNTSNSEYFNNFHVIVYLSKFRSFYVPILHCDSRSHQYNVTYHRVFLVVEKLQLQYKLKSKHVG